MELRQASHPLASPIMIPRGCVLVFFKHYTRISCVFNVQVSVHVCMIITLAPFEQVSVCVIGESVCASMVI